MFGSESFFMMDENFLLHRKRAMELLDCMKEARKSWELYVFSSANAISQVHDGGADRSGRFPGSGWGWNPRCPATRS